MESLKHYWVEYPKMRGLGSGTYFLRAYLLPCCIFVWLHCPKCTSGLDLYLSLVTFSLFSFFKPLPSEYPFEVASKMSVGFGFSAGDIITGLILIKNSIGAIHDTKGAQVDYRGLIQALDSLESGLEVVHDLEQEGKVEPHSKPWIAIRNATSKCKACIDEFLTSIDKYKCLGTPAPLMSTWKANVRKIKWAVCKQTDVDIFRGRLEIHCRSVSMLLITLQV